MPRDAESWLAERGVRRDAIRLVPTDTERADAARPADEATAAPAAGASSAATSTDRHGPDPSAREIVQLASEADRDRADRVALDAARPVGGANLEDDVAAAVAFLRRSTANAPQSVGRLRRKLAGRDTPAKVIELALARAHAERLVDDDAMARALVEEGRAKGHAPRRLRDDLRGRGFDDATIGAALGDLDAQDPEAAAFALARERAQRLTGVEPETAVRRIVGYLARRGHPEGLARKVARQAVDVSRDPQRTAGR